MEVLIKTVVTEDLDPSPGRDHLWAGQDFPAPGRTWASEDSRSGAGGQICDAAWGEGQGTRNQK